MNIRIPLLDNGGQEWRTKDKIPVLENISSSTPEGSDVEIDSDSCLLSVSSLGLSVSQKSHHLTTEGPPTQKYERCQQNQSVLNSEEEEDFSITSEKGTNSRSVSFGQITVRHYDRTVADHPAVSSGPGVGLDWSFSRTECNSVDRFEETRGRRRRNTELVLRRIEREIILKKDCKIPQLRIARTVRSVNSTKSRRRQTINNLKFSFIEEKWQSVTKKIKRVLGLRKSTKRQMELLWEHARQEQNRDSHENDASTCAISRQTELKDPSIRIQRFPDCLDSELPPLNRAVDDIYNFVEDNSLNSKIESTYSSTKIATHRKENRSKDKIHDHDQSEIVDIERELGHSYPAAPSKVRSSIRKVFKRACFLRKQKGVDNLELDERCMPNFDLDMQLSDSHPSIVCVE